MSKVSVMAVLVGILGLFYLQCTTEIKKVRGGENTMSYSEKATDTELSCPPDSDPIPAAVKRASRPVKPSNTLAIPSSSVL